MRFTPMKRFCVEAHALSGKGFRKKKLNFNLNKNEIEHIPHLFSSFIALTYTSVTRHYIFFIVASDHLACVFRWIFQPLLFSCIQLVMQWFWIWVYILVSFSHFYLQLNSPSWKLHIEFTYNGHFLSSLL